MRQSKLILPDRNWEIDGNIFHCLIDDTWWHRCEDDSLAGPFDTRQAAEESLNNLVAWLEDDVTYPYDEHE